MVKMALDKLSEEEIVELDEEKKAAMVSNLLVVLCADVMKCRISTFVNHLIHLMYVHSLWNW